MESNQSLIVNATGTALLLIALVLHIVCLSMPYYSEANFDNFSRDLVAAIKKDPTIMNLPKDIKQDSPLFQDVIDGMSNVGTGDVNFGMWKLCLRSPDQDIDLCARWSTKTTFDSSPTGMLKTLESEPWMRAVQAMSLIGMILLVVAMTMSAVNVVKKSKGDRLRLLYLFIMFFCVVAAIFIAIEIIIMSSNHKEAFDPASASKSARPPPGLARLFRERFHLSWGVYLDVFVILLCLVAAVTHFAGGRLALGFSGIV